MARKTQTELLEALAKIVGENDSEEYTSLMEDISDSIQSDSEDWKSRYEENDRSWRERYRNRFMGREESVHEWRQQDMMQHSEAAVMQNQVEEPEKEITSFDELFTEE